MAIRGAGRHHANDRVHGSVHCSGFLELAHAGVGAAVVEAALARGTVEPWPVPFIPVQADDLDGDYRELHAIEAFPTAEIEAFNTNLSLHAWSAIGFVCSFDEPTQRVGVGGWLSSGQRPNHPQQLWLTTRTHPDKPRLHACQASMATTVNIPWVSVG
jgi:hypothetical protein